MAIERARLKYSLKDLLHFTSKSVAIEPTEYLFYSSHLNGVGWLNVGENIVPLISPKSYQGGEVKA